MFIGRVLGISMTPTEGAAKEFRYGGQRQEALHWIWGFGEMTRLK